MARRYRTRVTEKKAVEFTLRVEGLDKYKDVWLTLSNNAREYPDTLYKLSNNSGSNIYVVVEPSRAESHKEWLSQFGEIIEENHNKIVAVVDIYCEYGDFDRDYIDCDYVFGEAD